MDAQEPTLDQLRLAAHALGRMAALVGDFYDVLEEFARGYATRSYSTPESGVDSPSVELSKKHAYIRLQIGALNEARSVAQELIAWRVDDARDAFMSWQVIGEALEISKQAVQQRYGPKAHITSYPPL